MTKRPVQNRLRQTRLVYTIAALAGATVLYTYSIRFITDLIYATGATICSGFGSLTCLYFGVPILILVGYILLVIGMNKLLMVSVGRAFVGAFCALCITVVLVQILQGFWFSMTKDLIGVPYSLLYSVVAISHHGPIVQFIAWFMSIGLASLLIRVPMRRGLLNDQTKYP